MKNKKGIFNNKEKRYFIMNKITVLGVILFFFMSLSGCSTKTNLQSANTKGSVENSSSDSKFKSTKRIIYPNAGLYVSPQSSKEMNRLVNFMTLKELTLPNQLEGAVAMSRAFSDGNWLVSYSDGSRKLLDKNLEILDNKLEVSLPDELAGFVYSKVVNKYYNTIYNIVAPKASIDTALKRENGKGEEVQFLSSKYYLTYPKEMEMSEDPVTQSLKEVETGKELRTISGDFLTTVAANDEYFFTASSELSSTSKSKAKPAKITVYKWTDPQKIVYQSQNIDGISAGMGLYDNYLILDNRIMDENKGIKILDLSTNTSHIIPATEDNFIGASQGGGIIIYSSWDPLHEKEIKVYDYQGKMMKTGSVELLK